MESTVTKKFSFWSIKSMRLYIALLLSLVTLAAALIRNNLGMAMVCMVNSTFAAVDDNQSQENATCSPVASLVEDYKGTFTWNSYMQGIIFSSMFIGGLISTIPVGWLADRYDPKILITIGMFVSSLGCLLTPITANEGNYVGLIVLRFIMGLLGQAFVGPAVSAIIARWIPPMERSTVIALVTSGNQASNIIGMPMNAVLCRSTNFLNGWPSIFYVNGFLCAISLAFCLIFVSNRPETNRFISDREKNFIMSRLADQSLGTRKEATKKIPWKGIFFSPIVWTILFSWFSYCLMAATLSTNIPTYFKEALQLSLVNNGLFSALPFLLQWAAKIVSAVIADAIKKRTNMSPLLISKLFNTFNTFGTAIFIVACSFMNCTTATWAVVLLSISTAMLGANVPGYQTSAYSIAPAFSGIISGLGLVAMQIGSFAAPLMVAALTPNQGNPAQWQRVFVLIAITMVISGVLYLLFGSVTIQKWAQLPPTNHASTLTLSTVDGRLSNSNISASADKRTDKNGVICVRM